MISWSYQTWLDRLRQDYDGRLDPSRPGWQICQEPPGMRTEKSALSSSMLHNLFFKAIFGQDYPNLGRLCNMLLSRPVIAGSDLSKLCILR